MKVNEQPTFPNNSALGRGIRVKMSGGYLAAAGATDVELGTLVDTVLATDTYAAVLPQAWYGARQMVANGAISQYATVYAAASGKVSSLVAAGGVRGIALEAASGDGAIISVLPQIGT